MDRMGLDLYNRLEVLPPVQYLLVFHQFGMEGRYGACLDTSMFILGLRMRGKWLVIFYNVLYFSQ